MVPTAIRWLLHFGILEFLSQLTENHWKVDTYSSIGLERNICESFCLFWPKFFLQNNQWRPIKDWQASWKILKYMQICLLGERWCNHWMDERNALWKCKVGYPVVEVKGRDLHQVLSLKVSLCAPETIHFMEYLRSAHVLLDVRVRANWNSSVH